MVSATTSLWVALRSTLIVESFFLRSFFSSFVLLSGASRGGPNCYLTLTMAPNAFPTSCTVPFYSKRCLTAMTWIRYSLLFPWPKANIWKLVPSGNLTLICLVSLFLCRSIGGKYRIGGWMVNVPFLHFESLRPLGRDLWAVLTAHWQSGVLRRSCLNGLFGGTHRVSCNQSTGNVMESEILNP